MKKFLAWFRDYLRTVGAALTRLDFYRGLGARKASDAVGYLAVLLILLWVVPFSIAFFVGMRRGIESLDAAVRTRVPAGTIFELKDGRLTSTLAEPLVFEQDGMKLVVNTASSTLDLAEGEEGVVVRPEAIVQKAAGRVESLSYADIPGFRMSREEALDRLARYAPVVVLISSLVVLLGVSFALAFSYAIATLVHGFALWLLLRLLKRPWGYRRAWITAAYAATAPLFVKAGAAAFGLDAGVAPTLLYWVLLGLVAYDEVKRNPAPTGGLDGGQEQAAVDRPDQMGGNR
jgi:hypothetical protein